MTYCVIYWEIQQGALTPATYSLISHFNSYPDIFRLFLVKVILSAEKMTIRNNYIKNTLTENQLYLSFEVVGPHKVYSFPRKIERNIPLCHWFCTQK